MRPSVISHDLIYVDTSVRVPFFLNEPHSVAAAYGYSRETYMATLDDVLQCNAQRSKIKQVGLRSTH